MTKEDVEIIILEYIKKNECKEDFVFSTSNIEEYVKGIKLDLILHDLIENGYNEKCGKPTPLGVGWIACF
ncbi:MAG: hypothetical protein KTQ14_01760 [Fusobacteriaceae bacterium]|nr:hypothetical protein [Fusobacteriaceae bacterium]